MDPLFRDMSILPSSLPKGLAIGLLVFFLAPVIAPAARECPPEPVEGTLALYSKDPASWKIVPRGAKGVVTFNRETGAFTFRARGLKAAKEYVLTRHDEGQTTGDFIAKGKSDSTGVLALKGTWSLWRGKIWLVPAVHVSQSAGSVRLTGWRPKEVLFEEKVLGAAYPCPGKK
jgi:hypothetical protein